MEGDCVSAWQAQCHELIDKVKCVSDELNAKSSLLRQLQSETLQVEQNIESEIEHLASAITERFVESSKNVDLT